MTSIQPKDEEALAKAAINVEHNDAEADKDTQGSMRVCHVPNSAMSGGAST